MKKAILLIIACAALISIGGCGRYYKVRDPGSDKVYYTDDYDNLGSGAIRFKDVVTRQKVTLSASEVIKISRDEYKANVHGR